MVGASNELPENEELKALYDRFLFRKKVQQLSTKGLTKMINSMEGQSQVKNGSYSPYVPGESSISSKNAIEHETAINKTTICSDDLINIRREAKNPIHVPSNVVQLILDIRDFMQEKLEPPVYVSDRRLLKAVNMLKVVAQTNGRRHVSSFDCLLLQHCLWQKTK